MPNKEFNWYHHGSTLPLPSARRPQPEPAGVEEACICTALFPLTRHLHLLWKKRFVIIIILIFGHRLNNSINRMFIYSPFLFCWRTFGASFWRGIYTWGVGIVPPKWAASELTASFLPKQTDNSPGHSHGHIEKHQSTQYIHDHSVFLPFDKMYSRNLTASDFARWF